MTAHNEPLADARAEAMKYFGHAAEAKKAMNLQEAKQQARATREQRRAVREQAQQAQLVKLQQENAARAQKQAAVDPLRTLRSKPRK